MTIDTFLIFALATFYPAFVITSSAGPFNLFANARAKLPHGGLLTCLVCLSFWTALALWFLPADIRYPLAAASGAVLAYYAFV
jgi:hypothetical protein